ncbi:hypothetical protein [Streptosporangium roseum]|uniref:hypothetical protein n=1 Tax=Streptosporangium roseum TaxID=2001 RepID=UPI0018CC3597|nr:hypothetical protein [Streptosporangium roseum]
MQNPSGDPRPIRVRWSADQPPMPLGCRWCGHPPYAHEAASLPHRAHHDWQQPTSAQVHARMTVRRRLGLCGRPPVTTPPRPLPRPEYPAVSPGRHRRQEQAVAATAAPYRRGRPPGTRTPSGGPEPYRNGSASHRNGRELYRNSSAPFRNGREPYRKGAA